MAGKGTVGQLLVEMRADLGKLRVDVKEMEKVFSTSFSNIQSQAVSFARTLASAFGIGLSINAVIGFGKEVLALGGQLKDLSQQTGISTQTLSGLKSTLEENGTTLDAFAKGIFTLQKNLGEIKNTTDPAAQAVRALGLNLDQLRKADTDTFLELVTDALGKIDNPLNRAQLGAALLGKNFRELGPAINEMSGRLAQLRKEGLSPEDINRLDEFGDSITRINNRIKLLAAEGLATLIRDLSNINFLFSQMFNKSAAVGAILGGAAGIAEQAKPQVPFTPPVDTASAKKLTDQVDSFIAGLQKQADALRVNIVEMREGDEAAKALGLDLEFAAFKARLLADNLKMPPDAQQRFDQLKASIIALNGQLAAQKKWLEDIQTISKAWLKDIDDMTKAQENWAEIKMDAESLGLDDLSKILDEIARKYTNLIVKAQEAAAAAGASPEEIEAVRNKFRLQGAREQAAARAAFTPEGADAEAEARARAEKLGDELANSLTSGMRNTLLGIETGQQTLAEGMKNLVRNMMLELQGAIFDKTILEPLKIIASGFISGFVGALDEAANKDLKEWAQGLGKQVSSWLGTGLSSILGAVGGASGGVDASTATYTPWEGGFIGRERGGMLPSFAGGGLFIGHGGEFVMQKKAVDNIGAGTLGQMNQTGKVPSGGSMVNVEINGDITPRQPNMTPDQIIKVTAGNITNDGMVMSAIEQRLRMKGR